MPLREDDDEDDIRTAPPPATTPASPSVLPETSSYEPEPETEGVHADPRSSNFHWHDYWPLRLRTTVGHCRRQPSMAHPSRTSATQPTGVRFSCCSLKNHWRSLLSLFQILISEALKSNFNQDAGRGSEPRVHCICFRGCNLDKCL